MATDWEYKPRTQKQIESLFNRIKANSDFDLFTDFLEWYNAKINDKFCHYCGLTERESQELVHRGVLISKGFPKNEYLNREEIEDIGLKLIEKHHT